MRLTSTRPSFLSTRLVREDPPAGFPQSGPMRGPADVHRTFAAIYDDCPQEVFVVFILNTRHNVVGVHEVTRGILDASLIHPREVFRPAILANAAGIIVAHNHPSGDPTPSPEDRAITRQLGDAGRAVGIPLLDHIVVGGGTNQYVSIATDAR